LGGTGVATERPKSLPEIGICLGCFRRPGGPGTAAGVRRGEAADSRAVDEFEVGVIALGGDVVHPSGDLLAVAVGAVLPMMMPIRVV